MKSRSVRCFQFHEFARTHKVGATDCVACGAPPKKCDRPDCSGLIHTEHVTDYDLWEDGGRLFQECDICGIVPQIFEMDVASLAGEWGRLTDMRLAAVEKARPATLEENIEAWVSIARRCPGLVDIRFLRPSSTSYEIPTPKHDSLDYLFKDSKPVQLFAQLQSLIEQQPQNVALRGVGISLYWQLSRFYPRLDAGYGIIDIDDDSGEVYEGSLSEPDESCEWQVRRALFKAFLSHLVSLLDVDHCVDWARTKWEIINAYAAGDVDLGRRLFRHAEERQLCPPCELIPMRCMFEYLAAFGVEIDRELGLLSAERNRAQL